MKSLVIVLLIGFGFAVGYNWPISSSNVDDPIAQGAFLSGLEKKVHQITENEMHKYIDLKDKKVKYDKANEILGKIMLVFLADLGLRLRRQKDLLAISEVQESAIPLKIVNKKAIESIPLPKQPAIKSDGADKVRRKEKSPFKKFKQLSLEERRSRRQLAFDIDAPMFQLKPDMRITFDRSLHHLLSQKFSKIVLSRKVSFQSFFSIRNCRSKKIELA